MLSTDILGDITSNIYNKSCLYNALDRKKHIKTINMINCLEEIYELHMKKAFNKIKEKEKRYRVSMLNIRQILQRFSCLAHNYEKKSYMYAFSLIKMHCLKGICINNEKYERKIRKINSMYTKLEHLLNANLLCGFSKIKSNVCDLQTLTYKRLNLKTMAYIIKKSQEICVRETFHIMKTSLSHKKQLKPIKVIASNLYKTIDSMILNRKQLILDKLNDFNIRRRCNEECNKQIILILLKVIWNIKNRSFSLIKQYIDIIKINEKNEKNMQNIQLMFMRKYALNIISRNYANITERIKFNAFQGILCNFNEINRNLIATNDRADYIVKEVKVLSIVNIMKQQLFKQKELVFK